MKTHEVEYNEETIYKTTKKGERIYIGAGKEVSEVVEAKVKQWLSKRESEDSD